MNTVADLIRELQKLDPSMPVLVQLGWDEGTGVDVEVTVTEENEGEPLCLLVPMAC